MSDGLRVPLLRAGKEDDDGDASGLGGAGGAGSGGKSSSLRRRVRTAGGPGAAPAAEGRRKAAIVRQRSQRFEGGPQSYNVLQGRRRRVLMLLDEEIDLSTSNTNLRRLFRILDTDYDMRISHKELKFALQALEVNGAEDDIAVAHLLRDMDVDRTGAVSEHEFVRFFSHVSLAEVRRRMQRYQHTRGLTSSRSRASHRDALGSDGSEFGEDWAVSITVVEYGPLHTRFFYFSDVVDFLDFLESRKLGRTSLSGAGASASSEPPPSAPTLPSRYWIDVCGLDSFLLQLLSDEFGIPSETIKDAAVFQRAKIETVAFQPASSSSSTSPSSSTTSLLASSHSSLGLLAGASRTPLDAIGTGEFARVHSEPSHTVPLHAGPSLPYVIDPSSIHPPPTSTIAAPHIGAFHGPSSAAHALPLPHGSLNASPATTSTSTMLHGPHAASHPNPHAHVHGPTLRASSLRQEIVVHEEESVRSEHTSSAASAHAPPAPIALPHVHLLPGSMMQTGTTPRGESARPGGPDFLSKAPYEREARGAGALPAGGSFSPGSDSDSVSDSSPSGTEGAHARGFAAAHAGSGPNHASTAAHGAEGARLGALHRSSGEGGYVSMDEAHRPRGSSSALDPAHSHGHAHGHTHGHGSGHGSGISSSAGHDHESHRLHEGHGSHVSHGHAGHGHAVHTHGPSALETARADLLRGQILLHVMELRPNSSPVHRPFLLGAGRGGVGGCGRCRCRSRCSCRCCARCLKRVLCAPCRCCCRRPHSAGAGAYDSNDDEDDDDFGDDDEEEALDRDVSTGIAAIPRTSWDSGIALVSERDLAERPPEILFDQVSILLASEQIVLTLRGDSDQERSRYLRTLSQRGSSGRATGAGGGAGGTASSEAASGGFGSRWSFKFRKSADASTTAKSSSTPSALPSTPSLGRKSGLGVAFAASASTIHEVGAGGGSREDDGEDSGGTERGRSIEEVEDPEVQEQIVRHLGVFRRVAASLRRRAVGSHMRDARALALMLADAVLDRTYEMRDVLKDWEEAIEGSLTKPGSRPEPHISPHLYALGKMSELYLRSLEPLWYHMGTRTPERINPTLFRGLEPEVGDSRDDLGMVLSDVRGILDTTKRLAEVYSGLQSEHMNRALYTLTIITTFVMPAQVLSGIYGTNFEHFPELKWEYSYLVFWLVLLSAAMVVFLTLRRLGYFAVLSDQPRIPISTGSNGSAAGPPEPVDSGAAAHSFEGSVPNPMAASESRATAVATLQGVRERPGAAMRAKGAGADVDVDVVVAPDAGGARRRRASLQRSDGAAMRPTMARTNSVIIDSEPKTYDEQMSVRREREEMLEEMDMHFTSINLRRFFRQLDVNGDGKLSVPELKRSLPFFFGRELDNDDDEDSLVALIMREMDQDHTGAVSEAEFVDYFSKKSIEGIRDQLEQERRNLRAVGTRSVSAPTVTFTAIEYGPLVGEDFARGYTFSGVENLKKFLREHNWSLNHASCTGQGPTPALWESLGKNSGDSSPLSPSREAAEGAGAAAAAGEDAVLPPLVTRASSTTGARENQSLKLWLDVRGFDSEVMTALSEEFRVPLKIMKDCPVFQPPKVVTLNAHHRETVLDADRIAVSSATIGGAVGGGAGFGGYPSRRPTVGFNVLDTVLESDVEFGDTPRATPSDIVDLGRIPPPILSPTALDRSASVLRAAIAPSTGPETAAAAEGSFERSGSLWPISAAAAEEPLPATPPFAPSATVSMAAAYPPLLPPAPHRTELRTQILLHSIAFRSGTIPLRGGERALARSFRGLSTGASSAEDRCGSCAGCGLGCRTRGGEDEPSGGCCSRHVVPGGGGGGGLAAQLVSERRIARSPPALLFDQLSVVTVTDQIVFTLRSQSQESSDPKYFDAGRDAYYLASSRALSNSEPQLNAVTAPLGVLQRTARRLLTRLGPSHSSSAKVFALRLCEAILDHTFEVRDTLKEWELALEASLTTPGAKTESYHSPHMYSFAKVVELYAQHLRPLLEQLHDDDNLETFERYGLRARVQSLAARINTIVTDLTRMSDSIKRLMNFYTSLQNEHMNRALYMLTILTTFAMPMTILTGVYGTNFQVLPELTWQWSYLVFWLVLIFSAVVVFFALRRAGLFKIFQSGMAATLEMTGSGGDHKE